jgi:hypothetical protein
MEYRKASLLQIHASFATIDYITRLIQKEKLTLYLKGKGLAGVVYKFNQKHYNPETVYKLIINAFK